MMADSKNEHLDEFMDDDDDHSMTGDDWVSYDDSEALTSESGEEFADRPQTGRKRRSFPTKLLIGAVLLAGGAIAFLQMGLGGGDQSQTPVFVASEPQMTEQQTWSPQSAAPVAIADATVPPMPATIEQDEGAGPEEVAAVSAQRMEGAESQVPRMPKVSDIMLKSAVPESTETSQTQQTSQLMPAPSVPAGDVAALSGKIDLLMTRLDKIEGSLDEVAALKDSVAALEKKVAVLSSKAEVKPAAAKPVDVKREEPQIKAPAVVLPDAAAPAPAPAPVILSGSAIEVAPTRAIPPKMPVESVAPNWILKGAQPGRAMVSKPGEGDMRTVEVGSVLSGIGQITDISFQNGKWVVTGTRGRITQ